MEVGEGTPRDLGRVFSMASRKKVQKLKPGDLEICHAIGVVVNKAVPPFLPNKGTQVSELVDELLPAISGMVQQEYPTKLVCSTVFPSKSLGVV